MEWNNNTEKYYIELQSLVDQDIEIMFRHREVTISENEIKPHLVKKGKSFFVSFKAGETKTLKVL